MDISVIKDILPWVVALASALNAFWTSRVRAEIAGLRAENLERELRQTLEMRSWAEQQFATEAATEARFQAFTAHRGE